MAAEPERQLAGALAAKRGARRSQQGRIVDWNAPVFSYGGAHTGALLVFRADRFPQRTGDLKVK